MDNVEIKKSDAVKVGPYEFVAPYDMVIISSEKYKQDEALLKTAAEQWSKRLQPR